MECFRGIAGGFLNDFFGGTGLCHLHWYSGLGCDASGDGIELIMGYFLKMFCRGGAVNGVDHHFAWVYAPVGFDESGHFPGGGVVDGIAVMFATQEHSLDYAVLAELFQFADHFVCRKV